MNLWPVAICLHSCGQSQKQKQDGTQKLNGYAIRGRLQLVALREMQNAKCVVPKRAPKNV